MITRLSKTLLFAGLALYYTLVVLNNTTDFDSNYQFVRHVLMMDSTFPGNRGMWRALNDPRVHLAGYLSIIAWETVTMCLSWIGVTALARNLRAPAAGFSAAKRMPILALTLGMLLWLVAFISVGGEWFLMWQSGKWNGQATAVRLFVVNGLVLLLTLQPERDDQP